jgi:hypothetical protein
VRVTWVKQSSHGVQWLGKPPSGRVGLTNQERFNEAVSYFPPCYTSEFDDCVDKAIVTAYPNCARILELFGPNKTDPVSMQLDAEIEKMPYCSASTGSSSDNSTALLVGVGVAALAIGFVAAGGLR